MSNNELIVIEQLPVIKEQLKLASAEVDKKVEEAMALVCTEDNVKIIKELRASLNKEAKEFEDKRKQVKSEVLKPYEEFEKVYKEHIIDKFKKADADLKEKIDSVENELKKKKEIELLNYFNEYLNEKKIDFVTIKQANINVTLSASMKSLKEQAKNFIDKIVDDLKLIETQEHKEEILYEYKRTLNISQSIMTVTERHKVLEKAKETQKTEQHIPTIEEVEQIEFEPKTEFELVPTKKKVALILDVTDEELSAILKHLDATNTKYELGGMLCRSIKQ